MLVGIINWFTTLNVLHWLEIMLHYLSITNYKLSVRQFFSSLFYGKKLFQQYAVDVYVKIEGQRLAFIRNNQNKLRSEQYVLHKHVNNLGNDHVRPGHVVVLPSTYVGSPRALKENFEDANFCYILLFVVLELLTYEDYKHYCSQNPGPLSKRSFNKWCKNVGIDEPSFIWRAHPYRGVGGHQRKKVVNVFYQ